MTPTTVPAPTSSAASDAAAETTFSAFVEPPAECRPRMRWWWFGPDVDRGELERELTAMRDAGIGGVEVAFEYPLSKVEHPFLSPVLLGDLRFAAQTSRSLGLGFDLTLGSGWSYGGPHIGPDTAARTLSWDVRDIGADSFEFGTDDGHEHDEVVAVFVGDGSVQELPSSFAPLAPADGHVRVPAGHGPRVLAIARSRLTGQQVKRAAAGAEGPVLDHYSAAATTAHLRAVADPMLDAVPADLIDSVFCDSLEVYDANWTPGLPAEFARRRGHDLMPSLWMLRFDSPESAAFRREYYATLGELYEENFLDVVRTWAARHGVPFRVQSYGAPPARLLSYGHADRVEGEGWGWRGMPQTRWAASAAHHLGRAVVSSETWTWVHSPSFRATPLDLKGEAHEHFLLGINQLVGHGWPYSAPDARGLGWFFYASGALDDRNAWWPAMPSLMRYLTRMSALLRRGEPVRDVLLYLPTDDVYPHLGPEQGGGLDLWRSLRAHIGDEIPAAIRDAGFDFDLVDDATLADALGQDSIVVLPFVGSLPERTRTVLDDAARRGVPVIRVEDGRAGELGRALREHGSPDLVLEPASPQVGFVHRTNSAEGEDAGGDVYVLMNTGPQDASFTAHVRAHHHAWQLWDPDSGTVIDEGTGNETDDGAAPRVHLAPYQAVVMVTDGIRANGSATATDSRTMSAPLTGEYRLGSGWNVRFGDGRHDTDGTDTAVALPHDWQQHRPGFAGSAVYECEFDADTLWPHGLPTRVVLDLGDALPEDDSESDARGIRGASYRVSVHHPVAEVASVEVDGSPCGLVYAPPYAVDVTSAISAGRHTLRIVVFNSTAAALADAGVRREIDDLVTRSRELYGMRFRMQDLDAASDGLHSGLLATPRLRWSVRG